MSRVPASLKDMDDDRLRRRLGATQSKLDYLFHQLERLDDDLANKVYIGKTQVGRTIVEAKISALESAESEILKEMRTRGLWLKSFD